MLAAGASAGRGWLPGALEAMRVSFVGSALPSLDAIVIEFSRLLPMFRWMKKFDRAAVLTDKAWLKKASELEGVLFPGLKIKAFRRDQKAEAEEWLSS